jgi:biopolymer transport protein TolR
MNCGCCSPETDAPYQRVIDATEALKKAKVTNVVLWTKQ